MGDRHPGGRPRAISQRIVRVEVSFTPDEWSAAEIIAASRSWYQLAAWLRELVKREIAKPENAELLGEDEIERARREVAVLRDKREKRVRREAARLLRLSGQTGDASRTPGSRLPPRAAGGR